MNTTAMKRLINSEKDAIPLLLRLTLGLVIIPQGYTLVSNYYESLDWLTGDSLKLPLIVAYLIIMIQFYASLFLIFGLASRVMAIALAGVVLAAIPFHFISELELDWVGQTIGNGVSFHVLTIVVALLLVIRGSGKWSLDRAITQFHL